MAELNFIPGTQYVDNADGKSLAAIGALFDAVTEASCFAEAWSAPDNSPPMAFVVQRMVGRIQDAADRVEHLFRQHVSLERAYNVTDEDIQ